MPLTFDDSTRELLDGTNFATVATLNPDGDPQTSVVWILREGDTVVFPSTTDRQKVRNLTRDARISLTVLDTMNPYRTVEIRGTAELVEDRDRAVQREVSNKYLGADSPPDPQGTVRVIVRVIPHKVRGFSN
ncbi:PPOX class F420-dependent oxidoreductase [Nocardia australiensis]|uniref:PPOX class F420-dependent oxidoreductase n=1 Tax=Nocardia australiensis TaxID=2887191 RepID=UPI001D14C298|nr:PPOX class F420-dependent oxidoreductase [Nocardia australiensis]